MDARYVTGCLVIAFALNACSDKIDNAVAAAKSLSAMGEEAKKMGEAAEKAAAAAKQQAQQQLAPGTDPNVAQEQVNLAGSIAAMQAMGAGTGPVVNWRELSAFVPEKIGAFEKQGELDGSTNSMGGMQVTKVERHYKAGGQRAQIEIVDANLVAMLKMPFAMISMINEDSTRGFKKGKQVAGHPAIVEWTESSKHSKVTILVGDRFIVNIEVRDASAMDAAEKLASALDIAALARLKPAAPAP